MTMMISTIAALFKFQNIATDSKGYAYRELLLLSDWRGRRSLTISLQKIHKETPVGRGFTADLIHDYRR